MKRHVIDSTKRVSDQFCHPTYDKHSWLLVSLCDTKKNTNNICFRIYLFNIDRIFLRYLFRVREKKRGTILIYNNIECAS